MGRLERKMIKARHAKILADALEASHRAFIEKFGREPREDDPLLWDPDADEPRPMSEDALRAEMIAAMQAAGLRPCLIYAFEKTGLIVSDDSPHTPKQRREFAHAIDEYYASEGH